MNLFDGKIYSSLVHQVKPDREIYQTLLDRFSLTPRETLFIDDSPINLPEAAALGIQTHHFTEADLCRRDLVKRGVSL
ncbi:MAG: HAD-IA family hydrolase [Spirochaetales bacterium]|nr:HAD-IA family hydrolase [Spirochaetales bacterium]